jgi:tripartite-type tricarboxylate transporter receptor subunit TctC
MTQSMKRGVLAVLLMAATFSNAALAQSANVTTVVVPFPAGGTLDVLARIITQKLGDAANEAFIVENRPGANGMIGAKTAAKAKADGRTWLIADGAAVMINPFLYPPDPAFSAEKDLRPVRALASQPLVLVVKKDFPAKTLKDFVALARRQEVTYSSGGIGSSSHLAMSYLSGVAGGLEFRHIPYRGGPQTIQALVTGEVDAGFIILPLVVQYIEQGQIVPIAVSGAKRSPSLPNVPTMIEQGYPTFEIENPLFAWLPAGTPDDVAKKVDAELQSALSDPAVVERIRGTGLEPVTSMGEAESRKWLMTNRDIWQKVIRDNHIKPE